MVVTMALVACAQDMPQDTADTTAVVVDTGEPALSGDALFGLACAGCHGADGRGGSGGPDLLERAQGWEPSQVTTVILQGAGFMEPVPLSEEDAHAVSLYVIEQLVGAG